MDRSRKTKWKLVQRNLFCRSDVVNMITGGFIQSARVFLTIKKIIKIWKTKIENKKE